MGFQVLRSLVREKDFVAVSELIRGNGNSVVKHEYQFVDRNVQPNVTYYYRLKDIDFNGNFKLHAIISVCLADNQETPSAAPNQFQLSEGYPNPFGSGVNQPEIGFQLILPNVASDKLQADIWNALGQKIRHLTINGAQAGRQTIFWNGLNEERASVPSGVYFLRFRRGNELQVRRVLLIR